MSYNFSYTGNPTSNDNQSAIGYRYSTNTGGDNDGGNWYSWRISPAALQNGTYIVNSSFISDSNSSNAKSYIYIVLNRTSTETYYGGIIDCNNYNKYNQGVSFDTLYTGSVQSGPLLGSAVYAILAGNETAAVGTQGISISTSAVFTYTQNPYGGTTTDNNTVVSVCRYSTAVNPPVTYITVTRIA